MSIIVTLIIGGIIGWLAARAVGREEGILASIVIGIIGAFIGTWIARAVGSGTGTYLAISWAGLVWSFIGAVIFAAILNAFQHRTHHHV
jgi:uncharacterized membrane protein YeaQ/YmgE (transglycosylase-associated protein family)